MKHFAMVAAVGIIAWSHVQAEDLAWPKRDGIVGATQLGKCLNGALDAADKRPNELYGLIVKCLMPVP
ncbi:MAG: hypothetical protein ABSC32_14615 [Steroidobacteraceae bacterium]